MSSNLTEQTLTAAVQQTFDESTDERFRQVFTCLVQHLHDFAREVPPDRRRMVHRNGFP